MSETSRPSHEIELSQFRQILIWPLALALDPGEEKDPGTGPSVADLVDRLDDRLAAEDGLWERVHDLADHAGPAGRTRLPPHRKLEQDDAAYAETLNTWKAVVEQVEATTDRAQSYGEFVYFYDFLQRTLFGEGDTAPFKLWRRKGIDGLSFKLVLNAGGKRHREVGYKADVRRFNLYTFTTGAAIAVVEIDFGQDPRVMSDAPAFGGDNRRMTLEDALTISDHLRRVYTPFFIVGDSFVAASRVPVEFEWLKYTDGREGAVAFPCPACGEQTQQAGAFRPEGLDATLHRVGLATTPASTGSRTVPVFDYWRRALWPVAFDAPSARKDLPIWRHVVDERVPLMSLIGLTGAAHRLGIGPSHAGGSSAAQRNDLALVSRGDWIRLCFADEAGNDPMPYNPEFLKDFEKKHCYDRFMASEATDSASRMLMASYHFAIVGSGSFVEEVSVHHFRRHYFQMMLLANMEFASLLATSSRISVAVDSLSRASRNSAGGTKRHKAESSARAMHRFGLELRKIQEDFLRFVHRFRFVGVSNQIQPTEIFDQLRSVMKLDSLYTDVKDELAAAVSFTQTVEQGEIAKSGMGLTAVATIAAAIGLALTFLALDPISAPLALIDWVASTQALPDGKPPALSVLNAGWRWLWALGPISIVLLIFLGLTKVFVWEVRRRLNDDDPAVADPAERLTGRVFNWLIGGCAIVAFVFLVLLGWFIRG